jgi:Domain of unknown function (DUF4249)
MKTLSAKAIIIRYWLSVNCGMTEACRFNSSEFVTVVPRVLFTTFRFLCFAFTMLAFWGCETLVNDISPDRLPTSKNQLVVHGYLSPQDTAIVISVQRSSPVLGLNVGGFGSFGGNTPSISGAKVLLTNRDKTIEVPFDNRRQQYAINTRAMAIRAGETYNLKITLGDQTVESSCKIPRAVFISEVNRDSVLVNAQITPAAYDLTYRLFWTDTRGEKNYYLITGLGAQTRRVQAMPNTFVLQPEIFNVRFGDFNGLWMTDDRDDGTFMISEAGIIPYGYRITPNVIPGSRRVEFSLTSYEKTYYEYHRAVQQFDNDNPFAEPSLVPSNIKGGLGCFAGYTRSARVGGW